MAYIWLIRHGQTDWNLEDRYQGQMDIPLNSTGLAQARRLAEYLVCQGLNFNAIYTSDLERATQTAQIINQRLRLPLYSDERLREIFLGSWEGKTAQEVQQAYGHCLTTGHVAADGESVQQVADRMTQAVKEYIAKHPQGQILIVSHGFALSTLLCVANGQPLERAFQIDIQNAHPLKICWDHPKSA